MNLPKRKPAEPLSQAQKMQATIKARKEKFENQTIVIDGDWKIVRADSLNWEIQFQSKFKGYFGNLFCAFQALPKKMIAESVVNDLNDVFNVLKSIGEKIEAKLGYVTRS